MSSNWASLKKKIDTTQVVSKDVQNNLKKASVKTESIKDALKRVVMENTPVQIEVPGGKYVERMGRARKEKYVGLDCEMVGIGQGGKTSALARCCLVSSMY